MPKKYPLILRKKILALPKSAGVYFFKDSNGRIIYIGKALNLKKRVQSHFSKKAGFNGIKFTDKITEIDWITTKNEKQAILLENQLIKKYQPRFNIQWRDDKSYFWVTFSQDEWPRVMIIHQNRILAEINSRQSSLKTIPLKTKRKTALLVLKEEKEKQSDFQQLIGPFVNGKELRLALRALRKIFPYRTCKNPYDKPCLQWHLGLCPAHRYHNENAPLSKNLSLTRQQNKSNIDQLALKRKNISPFFKKTKNNFLKQKKIYLNSLSALSRFLQLYAGESIKIEAYDISNIQGSYATGSMIVFVGDKPKKSDYRRFRIKTVRGANDIAMIKEVLRRRLNHPEWSYPDLILIDGGRPQLNAAISSIASRLPITTVVALAKKEEEIYTEYSDRPLKISQLPESLKLTFQRIRNEAHRFAIFYYRHLHHQSLRSSLSKFSARKKQSREKPQ